MRFFNISILLFLMLFAVNVHAKNQETNVNVILEIEGEYKFEPFQEESLGLAGLVRNGVLRVITESESGLSKYAALNDAMQKARREVWSVIQDSHITNDMTVKEAVLAAPTYYEYKEKDEEEKEKLAAMAEEDRKLFIEENGKEKKYDYDAFLDIVKECGKYKNSGRFYDAVEKKGYVCLEVVFDDFIHAVDNDKINIFKELNYGDRYRPVDGVQNYRYDAVIIDASETDYTPSLFVKVLSPTEETVYAGVAGKKSIFFVENIEEAKTLLGSRGVKKVYNTKSQNISGATGLIVSLRGSDRIFSAISKDKNIPFVIIYKKNVEEILPVVGE